jgi:Short C-terminal domain
VLGDNHRLREHLLVHGKSAPAEILELKERPWATKRPGELGAHAVYRLKLRVSPPDGPPFEVEITDQWRTDHFIYEPRLGERVSVLYDPGNHSKVVLGGQSAKGGTEMSKGSAGQDDELALLAALDAEEQPAAPPAGAPAGGPGRLDQLKQLGELHASGVLTDDEFAAEKARILGG